MMRIALSALLLMMMMTRGAFAREFSFDLWDWTAPCRDLPTFKIWAADLKKIGVTRLEISAPWNLLEPRPGEYDLSFIADRLAVAKSLRLGLRIRINSYYGGATPRWYDGDFWKDIHGKPPQGTPVPPSIADERFWSRYAPLCTAIARQFRGEDIYYNAFIGIHAELKFADWWSYDPSALAAWRKAVRDRPAWLAEVAGNADLPERPAIPGPTQGTPDASGQSRSWIAFREHLWRQAVNRFDEAIRAGDPQARISAPLGESFRRQSAAFSNLDYFGLSRGAQQVVHSYDFYWHTKDEAWMAGAAVASFRGITGIDDIVFEFDGPALVQTLGYDRAHQMRIADAALGQGAGLKAANYSYESKLPSSWPVLVDFGKRLATTRPFTAAPAKRTILLFMSKWANYCYREKTEWLHDAQFGAWRMLVSHDFPVRIICEDNLDENLGGYRGLYVAFSPPELMPRRRRAQLEQLRRKLPSVVELTRAPDTAPVPGAVPARQFDSGKALDYPLAYEWLRGDRAGNEKIFRALAEIWRGD